MEEVDKVKWVLEREWKEILSRCGVSARALDYNVEDKERIQKALESSKGFYLHGTLGTGKSVFLANFLKALLFSTEWKYGDVIETSDSSNEGAFKPFTVLSAPDFVMELQESYREDSRKSARQIITEYRKAPVLAIDDLGAERMTENSKGAFFNLINGRSCDKKKIYITSNLKVGELAQHIDSRIASRIKEICDIVEFTGNDRRLE